MSLWLTPHSASDAKYGVENRFKTPLRNLNTISLNHFGSTTYVKLPCCGLAVALAQRQEEAKKAFMTTRITQVDGQTATLRVEGTLHLADAELLESTYLELRAKHEGAIAIDLAGTSFLDSNSASILCRLKRKARS